VVFLGLMHFLVFHDMCAAWGQIRVGPRNHVLDQSEH